MGIFLDVCIVLIILFCALRGRKLGFVRTVFSLLSFVVAVVCAVSFTAPVAQYIQTTPIYEGILESAKDRFSDFSVSEGEAPDIEKLVSDSPKSFEEIISDFGTTIDDIKNKYEQLKADGAENMSQSLMEYIVTPTVNSLTYVVAFILIFIAAKFVLWIVRLLLDGLFKLPFLSGVNKFSGLVAGAILGVLGVFIFCTVASFALPYLEGIGLSLSDGMVERTLFYKHFVNVNPLEFVSAFFA